MFPYPTQEPRGYSATMDTIGGGKKTPVRRSVQQDKVREEEEWFKTGYLKPVETLNKTGCLDRLEDFQKLIWDYPADDLLPDYGQTPDQLAMLCGQGTEGWLLPSHITWVLNKLNQQHKHTINMCWIHTDMDQMQALQKSRGSAVERLNIIMNVGKNPDGSVYISPMVQSSNHWVLVAIFLSESPVIMYCDSVGWPCPPNLIQCLTEVTQLFGVKSLEFLILMHQTLPTLSELAHQCTLYCRNYPVHPDPDMCGLVTVVCAAICTQDQSLFSNLCGFINSEKTCLHEPAKYEHFLRRVLMYWFVSGSIDVSLVYPSTESFEHSDFDMFPTNISTESKTSTLSDSDDSKSASASKADLDSASSLSTLSQVPMAGTSTRSSRPVCQYCSNSFHGKSTLRRHLLRAHKEYVDEREVKSPCKCSQCSFTCRKIHDLISHYKNNHMKSFNIETTAFKTEEEFFRWKAEIEEITSIRYTMNSGTYSSKDVTISHYYCKRSGRKNMIDDQVRKRQRTSVKMDSYCTAFITARIDHRNMIVNVEYCLDHVGHPYQLQHLILPREIRAKLAEKQPSGVKQDAIFDFIYDYMFCLSKNSQMMGLCSSETEADICKMSKHKNEWRSIDLWAKQLVEVDNSPVIFFKGRNKEHALLERKDFLLCIQTRYERETMLQHGSKVICADSFPCGAQNDGHFIWLTVLDDSEEAVPVAWAITNRNDFVMLRTFLTEVRKSCGQMLNTHVFMSSLNTQFYDAWCACFSAPNERYYCCWRVDEDWRQHLNTLIPDKKKQAHTYAVLKFLEVELDKKNFQKMLHEFLGYLNAEAEGFSKYFREKYSNGDNLKLWTACSQMGIFSNKGKCVEMFQRGFKCVQAMSSLSGRVDRLLILALKIGRDRLIQTYAHEVGSSNEKEVFNRHTSATNISDVERVSGGEWSVSSSNTVGEKVVVKETLALSCFCRFACQQCSVCAHMYTCSCTAPADPEKQLCCEHVHAVHMNRSFGEDDQIDDCSDDAFGSSNGTELFDGDACEDVAVLKEVFEDTARDIISIVQETEDSKVLKAALSDLYKVYTTVHSAGSRKRRASMDD